MKDRGLTVTSVRKNKRELILSLASSPYYQICWLEKALTNRKWIEKQINVQKQNSRNSI